jgi:hypothetical protein
MDLEDAVRQFTKDHRGQFCDRLAKDTPTGEPWQIIVSGGGLETAADPFPLLCIDKEQAVALWVMAVLEYAKGRTGRLYWRGQPELREYQTTMADLPVQTQRIVETRYTVFSRLLISDTAEL